MIKEDEVCMKKKDFSIENSIDLNEEYQSVVDRYYSRKFCLNVCEPGDDYSVLIHSNGVCVISLAPSHNIVKSKLSIDSVNFQVCEDINRLNNKVSGKLKHGAQKVKPISDLLIVKLSDGSEKFVHCAIAGKLLEVNEKLIDDPSIMIREPDDVGYIAIILPDLGTTQVYRDNLLSIEQYENAIKHGSNHSVDHLKSLTN
nr:simiate [Microvelia americana]